MTESSTLQEFLTFFYSGNAKIQNEKLLTFLPATFQSCQKTSNVHRLVHGHMVLSLDLSHPVMCISSDKFMMHVIIVSSHRQIIAHLKHISIITYLAANRKERRKLDKIKKRKMPKCAICYFQKFYFRCISENIKLNIFHDFSRF